MGFFDQLFKKNTSTSGVTPNFVFGVEDTFQLKNSDDLIVVGRVKGTVVPGATASLHNFTDTKDATTAVTVKGIEVDHHMVSQATDSLAGLQIENGAKQNIRIGSVLVTGNISTAEVQTAYVNAIGNAYISVRNLNPSDEELERMSLTDLTEAWRLYQYHSRNINNPDPQDVQRSKKDRIAAKLCQRLMAQDHIHLIYNKNTGEPHLFSQVVNNQDGTYRCTPPEICIITNAYLPLLREQYSTGDFEIKTISRGEDGQGIVNVLGAAFYLNGACALDINGPQVGIMAEMLVPPPSFEGIPEIQIPVMNPDLMRWILMIGQLHEPTTDDAKTIFGLYYDFLLRELPKAKLLIPMKQDKPCPPPDEEGHTVIEKETTLQISTLPGKFGRSAVRMYTDWSRFRSAMGKDWDGMIQPVSGMIETFDCAINCTEYAGVGIYIDHDTYERAEKKQV